MSKKITFITFEIKVTNKASQVVLSRKFYSSPENYLLLYITHSQKIDLNGVMNLNEWLIAF